MKDAQMLPQYAVALLFVVGISVACVFAERRARDVQKAEAIAVYEKGWMDAMDAVIVSMRYQNSGGFSESMTREFHKARAAFELQK